MTETDWIVNGARIAVVVESARGDSVRFDTITGLTERYVTTGKCGKFLRRNLCPVGQGEYDPTIVRVLPPDDPYVALALARIRVRKVGRMADKAASGFRGDGAEALAVLDEIEQAVRAARQAITGKEA
ncbi:hypothetical protein [Plantactinospora sp. WMMB782]|uniref:hypothetical protein n=1 Tax=Plantactinospora sp. WMMB782 TaxID=3404121 RepID=UPI003B94E6E1